MPTYVKELRNKDYKTNISQNIQIFHNNYVIFRIAKERA